MLITFNQLGIFQKKQMIKIRNSSPKIRMSTVLWEIIVFLIKFNFQILKK